MMVVGGYGTGQVRDWQAYFAVESWGTSVAKEHHWQSEVREEEVFALDTEEGCERCSA
jgi:hypothetical protein